MSIDKIVLWYEENVNYKLTKSFLKFLISIGIVKEDIDLDFLNLYLLEKDCEDFIIENGKYKIKTNRIPVILNFKDEAIEKKEPKKVEKEKKPIVTFTKGNEKEEKPHKKFKIKSIGGNKMKLIKL